MCNLLHFVLHFYVDVLLNPDGYCTSSIQSIMSTPGNNRSHIILPDIHQHNNSIHNNIPYDAKQYLQPVDYAQYTAAPQQQHIDTPDKESCNTRHLNHKSLYNRSTNNSIRIPQIRHESLVDKHLAQLPQPSNNHTNKTIKTKFVRDTKFNPSKHRCPYNKSIKTIAPLLFGSSGSYIIVNDDGDSMSNDNTNNEEKQADEPSIYQQQSHNIRHLSSNTPADNKCDVSTQCDVDNHGTQNNENIVEQAVLKSAVLYQLYYVLISSECTLLPSHMRDTIELNDIRLLYKWSELDNSNILVHLVKLHKQKRVYKCMNDLAYALHIQHHIDHSYIQSLYTALQSTQWCTNQIIHIEHSIDIYKLLENTRSMYDCIHCINSLHTQQRHVEHMKHLYKLITAEHDTPLLCGRRQELLTYLVRVDCTLFKPQIHWTMSMINTVYESAQSGNRTLLYTQLYQQQSRQFDSIESYVTALICSHHEYMYIQNLDVKYDYIQISDLINDIHCKLFYTPFTICTDLVPNIINAVQFNDISHSSVATHIALCWIQYFIQQQYLFNTLDELILCITELQPQFNVHCNDVYHWLITAESINDHSTAEYSMIDVIQLVCDSGAMLQTLSILQEYQHRQTKLINIPHTTQMLRYYTTQQQQYRYTQLSVSTQQLYTWFQSKHCRLLAGATPPTLEQIQQLLTATHNHIQYLCVLLQYIQLSGQIINSVTQLQHSIRVLYNQSHDHVRNIHSYIHTNHSYLFSSSMTQYQQHQHVIELYYNSLAGPLTSTFIHHINITSATTWQQLTESIRTQFINVFDITSMMDIVTVLDTTDTQINELVTVLQNTQIISTDDIYGAAHNILLNSTAGSHSKHHVTTFANSNIRFVSIDQLIHTINVRHTKLYRHRTYVMELLMKQLWSTGDGDRQQYLFHTNAYIEFTDGDIYNVLDSVCGDIIQLHKIIVRWYNKSRQFQSIQQLIDSIVQRYNPELTPHTIPHHTYTINEQNHAHSILVYLLLNDNQLITQPVKQQINVHHIVHLIQRCHLGNNTLSMIKRLHDTQCNIDGMDALIELLIGYRQQHEKEDHRNQHIARLSELTPDQLQVYTYMSSDECRLLDTTLLPCTVALIQHLFELCTVDDIILMYIQLLNNKSHTLPKYATAERLADTITQYHTIHQPHVVFEYVDQHTTCHEPLCKLWLWLIGTDGQLLLPNMANIPTFPQVQSIHTLMSDQSIPYLQSMLSHHESFQSIELMLCAIQNRAALYHYLQQQSGLIDSSIASTISDQQLRYMLEVGNGSVLALAVYCMHMEICDIVCQSIDELHAQLAQYSQLAIQWIDDVHSALTTKYKSTISIECTLADAFDICLNSTAGTATVSCIEQLYLLQQSYCTVAELIVAVKHIFELRLKQRRTNRTILLDNIAAYKIMSDRFVIQSITDTQLQLLYGQHMHNEPYRIHDMGDQHDGMNVLYALQRLAEDGQTYTSFNELLAAVRDKQASAV